MKLIYIGVAGALFITTARLTAQQSEIERLYRAGDYATLRLKVDSSLQVNPGDKTLNLIASQVRVELRECEQAERFGERVIQLDQDASWPSARAHLVLAQCAFLRDDSAAVRQHLDRTLEMHATVNADRLAKTLKLEFGLDSVFADWSVAETEHIRFHYPPNSAVKDRVEFQRSRERALASANAFFGASLARKIDMFVWNSDSDAVRLGLQQLGFARPGSLLVHTRHDQTPGHEITHVLAGSGRHVRSIRLINEGLAVRFDGTSRDQAALARNASNEPAISLLAVWTDAAQCPDAVLYPAGAVLVDLLIKHGGRETFLKFLADQTYANAKKIYGADLDGIIAHAERLIVQNQ